MGKFIQEFSKPWEKYGLVNFMHDITFGKGQISMLMAEKDIVDFYRQHQIPTLRTDESGRTLTDGIYINNILETQYEDCATLMPLMVRVAENFNQNFSKNSIGVVARQKDCQNLYTLYFDLPDHEFIHWVVNNGSFMNDLISNYNERGNELILEGKSPENRLVLPNFNSSPGLNKDVAPYLMLSVTHKTLKQLVYLTLQQGKCLKLLMQGKSAKSIALEMKLSYRTVEHYLEKLRQILGCKSNKELIVSYIDQIR